MTEETSQKPEKVASEKATPIGRMTIAEVDAALGECDKTIKSASDLVKTKLASNATLPTNVLRDLSKANAHKGKLMMRRIIILIEGGDAAVMELLEKLMKVKLPKTQA